MKIQYYIHGFIPYSSSKIGVKQLLGLYRLGKVPFPQCLAVDTCGSGVRNASAKRFEELVV